MIKDYKNIILNSTILFVIATIFQMTLHEGGHFIMGILVNAKDLVLHHNYISWNYDMASLNSRILVAAGGPLVSLAIGLVFHLICKRQNKRNLFFLFNLYMSIFGYIGFWGYLLMTPFFTSGDTGFIAYALDLSLWLKLFISALGLFALFFIFKSFAKYFVEFGTREIIDVPKTRKLFIRSIMVFPLFIGITITTLLNLPVPTFLSLLYPLFSPFTLIWTCSDALNKKYQKLNMNDKLGDINQTSFSLFILFILIIIINRLLVSGISINTF